MSLFGFADPAHQAWMVLDRVRTEAYARAIAAVVRPGDVVLDIGTGSGVLALLAAHAGASHVFAVERTRIHELARTHVREAGMSDIVEVIHSDLLDLTSLPARPTVVLGEVLGHFAPDENLHALYQHAVALSAPDVRLIPESYGLTIGLADLGALRNDLEYLATGLPVRLDAMARSLLQRPRVFSVPSAELVTVESSTESTSVLDRGPSSYEANALVERDTEVNAIVVGFRSALGGGVELDTSASAKGTCWRQVVFPIERLPVTCGERVRVELEPRVLSKYDTYRWTVTGDHGRRSHDGLDAHGEVSEVEFARLLGMVPREPAIRATRKLRLWAAALGGDVSAEAGTMRARIRAALHDVSEAQAREAVLELLLNADALAREE